MKLTSENKLKLALKREGHDLIDEIARLGTHKLTTYQRLAKKLKRPMKSVHFGTTHTVRELEPMVEELRRFRDTIVTRRTKKPRNVRIRKVQTRPGAIITVGHALAIVKQIQKAAKPKRQFKDISLPRAKALPLIKEVERANAKRLASPWYKKWITALAKKAVLLFPHR